MIKKTYELTWT